MRKFSNLYISQVKRRCGIEVEENYNLPKSEGARGPVDLCFARTGAAAKTGDTRCTGAFLNGLER